MTAAGGDQRQWLVRKGGGRGGAKNAHPGALQLSILGPFVTEQIVSMIHQGLLGVDDELCPENGYWIFLHESKELKALLGIDVHLTSSPDEEATQPDISEERTDETTQPDFSIESEPLNPESTGVIKIKRPAATPAPRAAASRVQVAQVAPVDIANRFPRVSLAPPPVAGSERGASGWGSDKGRVWGIVFAVCVVLAIFGFVVLLKSLKAAG